MNITLPYSNFAEYIQNNNMAHIKAAFFDIDGTLVSFKTHKVPKATINALSKLRELGVKVFISSGRQFGLINNLGNLKFDGYVTINGAVTIVDGEMIDSNPIPHSDIKRIIEYMDENKEFPCVFVLKDRIVINYINEDVEEIKRLINFPNIPVGNLKEIENEDVYQMISFFKEDVEPEIMSQIPNCTTARWSPIFADIIAKGTSKVTGIGKICQHFGIKREETIAFGDGGNDIEMLQWAGIGVAMGNAEEKVKKVADYVTSSVDEEGVLKAVEHYFN